MPLAVAVAVTGIDESPKIEANHIGTVAVCCTTMPLALSGPVQEMPVELKHFSFG